MLALKPQLCCSHALKHETPHLRLHINTRSKRTIVVTAAKGGNSSGGGGGFGQDSQQRSELQDVIKQQRNQQLAATDLIAKLLRADTNPKKVAEEYIDSLTEEFFHIGAAYLSMAEKEPDKDVYNQLKTALQAAMEVKQSTLRPEIQLLNKLLQAETPLKRKQILNTRESGERLLMNDKYFFGLLTRMKKDVEGQPDTPQRADLIAKLVDIERDALGRLPR